MLKSNKHIFWEALIITIVIFLMGLFLGMMIEAGHSNEINNFYLASEANLIDGMALSQISGGSHISCETIKQKNIDFANKVYEEAKLLEKYESSQKLTENLKIIHKKYDLLRTLAWISNSNSLEQCQNYDLVIYLYEYNSENITKKAIQNVWSKILLDVKEENEDMILIPIASDQDITSLEVLMEKYGVSSFPALVINNQEVIYSLEGSDQIKSLLN